MKNKALIVALSEFTTLVRSKAFLAGLLMMPVFMGIAIGVQRFTRDASDIKDRPFVVVDRSGVLFGPLKDAADEWNRPSAGEGAARTQPRFLPSIETFDASDERARAALSDRVRRDEIFAFVEIPADALDPDTKSTVSYYSNHPAYRTLPGWIGATINREIMNQRFRAASIDRAVVSRLTRRVEVSELGLLERDTGGTIHAASRVDKVRTTAIPVGMMMILLFSVISSAPQLLNSVIEEKMSRISEVLIGSVTPYQLMMGKLIASAAVSVLLASIYMTGGVMMARYYGYGDAIHPSDLAWLFLFLAMAAFIFGSIFITIGAACSDLKDAQGMMTPAMLFLMLPWMTWFAILNAPESPMSVGLSLFPTATPFLMLLRIAIPPGPPMWQILLSVVLTGATTVALVHAAGKVFRTGLLMQGKAATLGEMWKWVRAE
ncbi:MAG TPA: ABC transporter permease [Vicinamibacterales bacterium]|nr:ABC transporter permease [Vicinamibacterales bacterium]